ncbi:MAG: Ig-like domain repeat protein, partial [Bacteroidota bacterium]
MKNLFKKFTIQSYVFLYIGFAFVFSTHLYAQTAASEAWNKIYSINTKGNITFIGNTNASCTGAVGSLCDSSHQGIASANNNSAVTMTNIDVDADGTTPNSSSAVLTLPNSATVLYAGLFWGGARKSTGGMDTIKFATPVAGYTALKAQAYYGATTTNAQYQCYYNVTSLVQAGGSGTYFGAKITSSLAGTGPDAGWVLQVVYSDPSQVMRNINVYRGLTTITSATSQTIAINGFKTPTTGNVYANIGLVGWDGDKGPGSLYLGDSVKFKNTYLSNGLNPINDILNSSMTIGGVQFTAKNPNYVNQLGVDADIFSTTNVLAPGDTSANLRFSSGGETYTLGCVTTSIEINAPNVNTFKSAFDINGGNLSSGDTLEYTIGLKNAGLDSAVILILRDTIQANATYVPGSMYVISGYNSGIKTDATGDDQADYNGTSKVATFRLGRTATSAAGGVLGINVTTQIKFRVKVNTGLSAGTKVNNQSVLTYNSQGTGAILQSTSYVSNTVVGSPVASTFNISPSSIAFGSVASGSSKTDSVKVVNSGYGLLNISSVDSNNSQFRVTPKSGSVLTYDTVTYYITYTPSSSGATTGNITFTHNASGSPSTVSLTGTGTGTFYTLNASAGANGTISPSGSMSVATGSSKVFTITPNVNFVIDSIIDNSINVSNISPYTLSNITANHTIVAKFDSSTHPIIVIQGANGTIAPGTTSVAHGANQTFTITPSTGYNIDSVFVDGVNAGAVASYTFTNVNAFHTIRGVYKIKTYSITVTQGANGTIAPGTTIVNHGANQTFSITPNANYGVDSIIVDGANAGAVTSYTFTNVTATHTITANFSSSINSGSGVKALFGVRGAIRSGVDSSNIDDWGQGATGNGVINNDGTPNLSTYKWTSHTKDGAGASGDGSIFTSNFRAYDTPRLWTIGSGSVNNKTDLVNVYAHARRDAADSLWLFLAAERYGVTGSTALDLEFLRKGIIINGNGTVSPGGTDSGRTAGVLTTPVTNGGGTISKTGDLMIVTEFGGSSVSTFVYMWCRNPGNGITWNASTGYSFGWGLVNPPAGSVVAAQNLTTMLPGAWGSKQTNANPDSNVTAMQVKSFVEVGLNLHKLGLDNAVNCTKVVQAVAHTRTSVNWTNNMEDIALMSLNVNTYATVSVKKYRDSDGLFPSTTSDTTAKTWGLALYKGSVSTANKIDSVVSATQIGPYDTLTHGTYILVETDSANWDHLGVVRDSNHTLRSYINTTRRDTFTVQKSDTVIEMLYNSPHRISSSTVVSSNDDTSGFGQSITFTAVVTPVVASGTITFKDGAVTLGTSTITGGTAILSTSSLTVGTHSITAVYNGDNSYYSSTSPAITQVVKYSITIATPVNGTISPSGTILVNSGSNASFTMTPSVGYHIDSVFVDGAYVGTTSPYTISNITANHTVLVKYAINTYTLTVTQGANGT